MNTQTKPVPEPREDRPMTREEATTLRKMQEENDRRVILKLREEYQERWKAERKFKV